LQFCPFSTDFRLPSGVQAFDCGVWHAKMIRQTATMPKGFAMIRLLSFAFSILLWSSAMAWSAPYPEHSDLYVNDLAGVLDASARARLASDLAQLKTDTGIEMTVLTIPSRKDYDASPSIEAFATGLFNSWGIGRAKYNDGILVLVAVNDHEMRLELGSGYSQGFDLLAQDIVDRWFLPEFRKGDFGAGISAGVRETIERIARRQAQNLPAEKLDANWRGRLNALFPWLFAAAATAVVGLGIFGQRLRDWSYRLRRCPSCGQRGLHREHVLPADPKGTIGNVLVTCPNCSYRNERPWPVARAGTSKGGGSFGGGHSSGGGASGRW
jgi:uncharacterized protein